MRAQVKVGTFGAAKEYSGDARLLASVADDVLMTDADLGVVNDNEVVLSLIADAIICTVT